MHLTAACQLNSSTKTQRLERFSPTQNMKPFLRNVLWLWKCLYGGTHPQLVTVFANQIHINFTKAICCSTVYYQKGAFVPLFSLEKPVSTRFSRSAKTTHRIYFTKPNSRNKTWQGSQNLILSHQQIWDAAEILFSALVSSIKWQGSPVGIQKRGQPNNFCLKVCALYGCRC